MRERKDCIPATLILSIVSMTTLCFVKQNCAYAITNGNPIVVSLGDSYSSGEGTEPFYDQDSANRYESPDFVAHRSEKGWPGQLVINGTAMKKDTNWFYVAASGATTEDVLNNGQLITWEKDGHENGMVLGCQMNVFTDYHLAGIVDYVTITIGGNDVGFERVVETACKNNSIFEVGNLESEIRKSKETFEGTTRNNLQEIYKGIRNAAGNQAQVIVAGYPHLFSSNGGSILYNDIQVVGTLLNVNINSEDAQLINDAVNVLDEGIREEVSNQQNDYLWFVDVRPFFNGHEEEYIHPVYNYAKQYDLGEGPSHYSVHPNEKGQQAYRDAVQTKIKDIESGTIQAVDVESNVAMSLVFDVSGSMNEASAMGGMSKLDSAKKQSSDFVSSVSGANANAGGLSVRVGVCSFASSATTNRGLSNDPSDINESIAALRANGQTNMYAGLTEGINQLLSEDGPKLMVYLSDGLSNVGGSQSDILDLAWAAAEKDIKIYTIGFGSSAEIDEGLLKEIASITGGEYSHEDSANISSAAVGLFATMMNARLQAQYNVLNSLVGSVAQDALTDAGTFDITKNGTVQVYLYWPGSVLDMQLTDPSGTQVTEGYIGYTIDTSTIPTSITIQNAKQGTWSMSVYGREVSMAKEPFYAVAAFEESAEPSPSASGGGAQDGGTTILLLVAVAFIGCMLGVYALTVRRR